MLIMIRKQTPRPPSELSCIMNGSFRMPWKFLSILTSNRRAFSGNNEQAEEAGRVCAPH